LADSGHTPIILDSLIRGPGEFARDYPFYWGDIADGFLVERIFRDHRDIDAAIHCAALIVIPESVEKPVDYYTGNVVKSLSFLKQLVDLGCPRLIFSSSASVYAQTPDFVVTESSQLEPASPYARTKLVTEMMIRDMCAAFPLRSLMLRYFNPIGADPRMRTGPFAAHPSHLLGRLIEVVQGRDSVFQLTGTQWPTRDGTAIRDYVHVWDLALAHVRAVERCDHAVPASAVGQERSRAMNLGSGNGVTVREFVDAFNRVVGRTVPEEPAPPRPGDAAGAYASIEAARKVLGWQPARSIEEGIASALEWDLRKGEVLKS
jgi:UDP-glucose 4-epimerase